AFVETLFERQQPMRERSAGFGGGDVEGAGSAVVGQADADVDPDAEADARDRKPQLPRMAQIEAQRQARHGRKSSMRPARIVTTRLACAASSALWVATINVALRSRQVRRSSSSTCAAVSASRLLAAGDVLGEALGTVREPELREQGGPRAPHRIWRDIIQREGQLDVFGD